MSYVACDICHGMVPNVCEICIACEKCCHCIGEAYYFWQMFQRDIKLIARITPSGKKDIASSFAYMLYVAGFLRRETPFEVVFEDTPGFYIWCSRDYERVYWCTITG